MSAKPVPRLFSLETPEQSIADLCAYLRNRLEPASFEVLAGRFGCKAPPARKRLRTFLEDLVERRVIERRKERYTCLPSGVLPTEKRRPTMREMLRQRETEAKQLVAWARGQTGRITTLALRQEGLRLGIEKNRVNRLIMHLRGTGQLLRGHRDGVYKLPPVEPLLEELHVSDSKTDP